MMSEAAVPRLRRRGLLVDTSFKYFSTGDDCTDSDDSASQLPWSSRTTSPAPSAATVRRVLAKPEPKEAAAVAKESTEERAQPEDTLQGSISGGDVESVTAIDLERELAPPRSCAYPPPVSSSLIAVVPSLPYMPPSSPLSNPPPSTAGARALPSVAA